MNPETAVTIHLWSFFCSDIELHKNEGRLLYSELRTMLAEMLIKITREKYRLKLITMLENRVLEISRAIFCPNGKLF